MNEVNRHLELAAEAANEAFRHLGEALGHFANAATEIVNGIGHIYTQALAQMLENRELWQIATPRQWHLIQSGSPRVSKKWRNALRRKKRIAEKRKGGNRHGKNQRR